MAVKKTKTSKEFLEKPNQEISREIAQTIVRPRGFAMSILGLGLAFGILHSYFFFDQKIGISYPIFISLDCIVLWYLGKTRGQPMNKKEFYSLLPILYFSFMVAVRSAELLTFLNIVVSFF